MLLAGILLKVGIYGVIKMRVMCPTLRWIRLLSMLGLSLAGAFALASRDRKTLRAYSRVVHINLIIYSLRLMRVCNMTGSTFLSVRHGYASTFMFYTVGILYRVNGRRILYTSRGLRTFRGYILLFIFITLCGNVGFPPLLSF